MLALAVQKQDKLLQEQIAMEKEIKSAKENLIGFDKKLIKLQKDSSEKSVSLKNKNLEVENQKN